MKHDAGGSLKFDIEKLHRDQSDRIIQLGKEVSNREGELDALIQSNDRLATAIRGYDRELPYDDQPTIPDGGE